MAITEIVVANCILSPFICRKVTQHARLSLWENGPANDNETSSSSKFYFQQNTAMI